MKDVVAGLIAGQHVLSVTCILTLVARRRCLKLTLLQLDLEIYSACGIKNVQAARWSCSGHVNSTENTNAHGTMLTKLSTPPEIKYRENNKEDQNTTFFTYMFQVCCRRILLNVYPKNMCNAPLAS